jgi:hypothetical protein
MLFPANPEALEVIRALPIAQPFAADIIQMRNGGLHRKAFAFLKLAHQLWQPVSFLTKTETDTVRKLGNFLVASGLPQETVGTLTSQFLQHLNDSRAGIELEKDFDTFRDFITVEAGLYEQVITPAGPRRIAKSWAYKNMAQEEFERLYREIKNTCWELVLKQSFASMEQAEVAAEQLLRFD